MFVIITGDLFEGIREVIGPFELYDEAEEYAESHNMGHMEWNIYEVLEKNTDERGQT